MISLETCNVSDARFAICNDHGNFSQVNWCWNIWCMKLALIDVNYTKICNLQSSSICTKKVNLVQELNQKHQPEVVEAPHRVSFLFDFRQLLRTLPGFDTRIFLLGPFRNFNLLALLPSPMLKTFSSWKNRQGIHVMTKVKYSTGHMHLWRRSPFEGQSPLEDLLCVDTTAFHFSSLQVCCEYPIWKSCFFHE